MKLVVIGYYHHFNFGDDQYEESIRTFFTRFFPIHTRYTIKFVDCDKLGDKLVSDDDVIIIGGGDVLNEYFVEPLSRFLGDKKNTVIAFSVGCPFPSYLGQLRTKLAFVSHFFIRTAQDIPLFRQTFGEARVSYLPDVSCLLNVPKKLVGTPLKKLGVNITRHFYSNVFKSDYIHFVETFAHALKFITVHYKLSIIFVPFNIGSPNENDNIIHRDIADILDYLSVDYSFPTVTDYKGCFGLLRDLDIVIASRFHAILGCLYANVPVLPIYTTRKVHNLIKDTGIKHSHRLQTTPNGIPIGLDTNEFLVQFIGAMKTPPVDISHFMESLYKIAPLVIHKITDTSTLREPEPTHGLSHAASEIQRYLDERGLSSLTQVTDPQTQSTVVRIASYCLTGGTDSVYNWGLATKMFTQEFDMYSEFGWILGNVTPDPVTQNPKGLFNLDFIDQCDRSGVHRSGWRLVYDALQCYQSSDSVVLFDLYMDRTFHWAEEALKFVGVLPYRRYWMGVLHHTFDETFSEYNCVELFKRETFRESLQFCRGLIVLSDALKEAVKDSLANIGFSSVPVHTVIHPTDTDVKQFSMNAFLENGVCNVLHVGGWLRNVYSFYKLGLPETAKIKPGLLKLPRKVSFRKVALKGRENNNYFPLDDFADRLRDGLSGHNSDTNYTLGKSVSTHSGHYTHVGVTNNWCRDMYNDTLKTLASVTVISHLSAKEYDDILSRSVVWLNLVDASAVNTLVECIVRNTPIFINPLPAVVELLGTAYPLYTRTQDLTEMKRLIPKIPDAHRYLKRIDKTQFTIGHFKDMILKVFQK